MRAVITEYQVTLLTERVKDLEEKVFKRGKKINTTRGQQVLLLKDLGLLDTINNLKLTKEKKAKLLSVLLNADYDNIYDDLVHIDEPKSGLKIKDNYQFLIKTYDQVGLVNLKEHSEKKLYEIIKLKEGEKSRNKK
jgi:hypothetical protein